MPQLNITDFAPQLIWLAITFAVLYIAMAGLALPRVERVITERKNRVATDLESARQARAAASEESARYDAEIAAAKASAQGVLRTAREKLDAQLASQRAAADRENSTRVEEAQALIQERAAQTSSRMDSIASEVVGEIVKELAGIDVSEAEVQGALRKA